MFPMRPEKIVGNTGVLQTKGWDEWNRERKYGWGFKDKNQLKCTWWKGSMDRTTTLWVGKYYIDKEQLKYLK